MHLDLPTNKTRPKIKHKEKSKEKFRNQRKAKARVNPAKVHLGADHAKKALYLAKASPSLQDRVTLH